MCNNYFHFCLLAFSLQLKSSSAPCRSYMFVYSSWKSNYWMSLVKHENTGSIFIRYQHLVFSGCSLSFLTDSSQVHHNKSLIGHVLVHRLFFNLFSTERIHSYCSTCLSFIDVPKVFSTKWLEKRFSVLLKTNTWMLEGFRDENNVKKQNHAVLILRSFGFLQQYNV